ncbi:MAG TPA: hypothetical protein VKD67_03130 [Acidimicrobiales bacterium]|nr:hypothetical protein [Acidimicrobiales bacterium]
MDEGTTTDPTAGAADGDPLKLGDSTNTHTAPTIVNYTGPTVPASTTIEAGDETAARRRAGPA